MRETPFSLRHAALKLATLYEEAEVELLRQIAGREASGIGTDPNAWREQMLKNAKETKIFAQEYVKSLDSVTKNAIETEFTEAYLKGQRWSESTAKVINDIHNANLPPKMIRLIAETQSKVLAPSLFILRRVDDIYREMTSETLLKLQSVGGTRLKASQDVLNKYADRGILNFVDKAGRQWDMSSYAEMCMRTGIAHSAREGFYDSQTAYGNDLVYVSSHGGCCPLCAKWEGAVLSISGNTPGYPTIEEARAGGLHHPNCEHREYPYIPGYSKPVIKNKEQSEKSHVEYDARQKQRYYERNLRKWKRREATALTDHDKRKAQAHQKAFSAKIKAHCEKHDIPRLRAREGIGKTRLGEKPTKFGGTDKFIRKKGVQNGSNGGIIKHNPYEGMTPEQKKTAINAHHTTRLEQWAKDKWGVDKVDLKGLDSRAINATFKQMDKAIKEFPALNGSIREIIQSNVGIMSATPNIGFNSSTITFNSKYYSKLDTIKSTYESAVSAGHFPKGTQWTNPGVHELGHILNANIIKNEVPPSEQVHDWNNGISAKNIVDNAIREVRKQYVLPKGTKSETLRSIVSGYGCTNDSELIAESFSDYHTNGENATFLSKAIIKQLKKRCK